MLKIVDFFWGYLGIGLFKLFDGFIWVLSIDGGIGRRVDGSCLLLTFCWLLRIAAGTGLKVFRDIFARFWELAEAAFPRPGEEVTEPEAGHRLLTMPWVPWANCLDCVFITLAPRRLPMVNIAGVMVGETSPVATLSFIGLVTVARPKPPTSGDILSLSNPLGCGLEVPTYLPSEPLLN